MAMEVLDGVLVLLLDRQLLLPVMEVVVMAMGWEKLAMVRVPVLMEHEMVNMVLAQQVQELAMETLMVPLDIKKMGGGQEQTLTALLQLALDRAVLVMGLVVQLRKVMV